MTTSCSESSLANALRDLKIQYEKKPAKIQQALNCFNTFQLVIIRISHKLQKESEYKLASKYPSMYIS